MDGGFGTSNKEIIFSWSKKFSNLISLNILLASIKSSNALGIFFIATFIFSFLFILEHTTPYAPTPIPFINSYLSSTTNVVPKI